MDSAQSALYQRLQRFEFDDQDGAEFRFVDRPAQENGWSAEFTSRVLDEYRRFILLCATAGHPVTPSDAVDQAWHLHMIFTRSYWDRMCGETIGRAIHHGPTKGGASEQSKFIDWYAQTLATYESTFGEPAPSDIWPAPAVRFAPARFQRINRNKHWVIAKPRFGSRSVLKVLSVLGIMVVAGCTAPINSPYATKWVIGALALLFVAATVSVIIKRTRNGGGDGSGCAAGGCSTGHGSGCGSGCGGDSGGGGCGSGCGGGCGS